MANNENTKSTNPGTQGGRGGENDRERPLTSPASSPQGQEGKAGNQGGRGGENDRERPLTSPASGPQGQEGKTGNQGTDRANKGPGQTGRPGDNPSAGGEQAGRQTSSASQQSGRSGKLDENDDSEGGPEIVVNPNKSKTESGSNLGGGNRPSGNPGAASAKTGGGSSGNR